MTESDIDRETKSNLEYLGSLFGGIVILWVLATVTLVALGTATVNGIPQAWFATVIVPVVLMAAIQVFGKDVYNVFKKSK